MNKALLSLVVTGLALFAVQTSFAKGPSLGGFGTGDFAGLSPLLHFPQGAGFFPLQEAYRLVGANTNTGTIAPGADRAAQNLGFSGSGFETGIAHYPAPTQSVCDSTFVGNAQELVTAVPGIFALASTGTGPVRLNTSAFAVCPPGYTSPVIENVRLTKTIPFQPKCPGVFPGATYLQFGSFIRTWWALLYSPPGTKFVLQLTVVCQGIPSAGNAGKVIVATDEYEWHVVVSPESLLAVVDVLHSHPVGTSEIPCIAAEDVYLSLRLAVAEITCQNDPFSQQNALFGAESLVIAFCAFGDCFTAEDFFSTFPPSNDVDLGGAFGPTGILDTIENPCCCKLLVDLDNLGKAMNFIDAGP